ncbi:hypothetical protein C5167_045231 [Papaver somniferum]|uniref:Uncharacterized protein n=1 Tax=Papaver somniferum TaxID=3469 RepID=A0A4Y7LDT0_PAPSO|nr:hypothetical protein C5167_045231 [Papaver somniferum]
MYDQLTEIESKDDVIIGILDSGISSYLRWSLSRSPLVGLLCHATCSYISGFVVQTNEIFIHEQEFEPFSTSGSVVRIMPTLGCILADMVHGVDFRSAVRYGNYFMLHNFKV